jgi:DNA-directed RNA polymerase subunit alpha
MKPQFTVTSTDQGSNSARFVFEPLPQGFGQTLGTSLRRVLYSSISGAAITSVKITGANHQFSTLPGVVEDLVHVVLNLKQIRIKYNGTKPAKLILSAKGESTVTASDFECSNGAVIVNPGLVIAHLSDKSAKLEIEANVETGFGYSPAEDRKSTTVGLIPTDAVFSPVIRVNVAVEATRVGRITNYDRLVLDISTDGTLTSKEALENASDTLVSYFNAISNPQDALVSQPVTQPKQSAVVGGTLSIEELDLPTRIANALQKAGFETVSDLYQTTREELAKVKNVGSKSVKLVEAAMIQRGLVLP